MVLPIGFSFGKNSLTNCWFTTATGGDVSRSCSSNERPIRIGMPIVSKKRRPTLFTHASSFGPAVRPLSPTLVRELPPDSSGVSERLAASTPGIAPTAWSRRSNNAFLAWLT